MNFKEIVSYIDHTQLKAVSTWKDIQKLCDEAVLHHTASVCIPPSYVARVRQAYCEKINICTVIGFPLGYHTRECKIAEAVQAISEGADEIDMVVNLGDVKNEDFSKVKDEISEIKKAIGSHILKVIVETCYLTEEEKISLCHCVTDGGADFIKTSTGFGTAGANLDDVELFKKHLGKNVQIKASGGVSSKENIEAFIVAGCKRIGTSSAVKLLGDL